MREFIFDGQPITVGSCYFDTNGTALYELSTPLNVWKMFKRRGFDMTQTVYLKARDQFGNLVMVFASVPRLDGKVDLYYQYAYCDTDGETVPLSESIDTTTMQLMGNWLADPYTDGFSITKQTEEEAYRTSIYFHQFTDDLANLSYWYQQINPRPYWWVDKITIFNGYDNGAPQIVEPENVRTNYGYNYPEGEVTILANQQPIYVNGNRTENKNLPESLVINTLSMSVDGDYTQDTAGTGGGAYGNYGYGGKPVDFWDLPGLSVLDTGFVKMYNPTMAEMRALGSFMWTDNFFDNIIKLIADPIENIIQIGIVPLDLSSIRGTTQNIYIGNMDSEVPAYPLTTQYITVDLGSFNIRENWGNALDYAPFTDAQLYLPFVGFVPISITEVMDSTITLRYYVDLLSGDCVAAVKVDKISKRGVGLHSVMYHHKGNLLLNIPITGANYGEFYKNLMTAPLQIASGASGGLLPGIASGVQSAFSLADSAGNALQRSGSFTGASGLIGCYTPYVALTRPIQQLPAQYSKYVGFPAYITSKLSDLKGFTMVESVIDNTVTATQTEKDMIEQLLREGVYI